MGNQASGAGGGSGHSGGKRGADGGAADDSSDLIDPPTTTWVDLSFWFCVCCGNRACPIGDTWCCAVGEIMTELDAGGLSLERVRI